MQPDVEKISFRRPNTGTSLTLVRRWQRNVLLQQLPSDPNNLESLDALARSQPD